MNRITSTKRSVLACAIAVALAAPAALYAADSNSKSEWQKQDPMQGATDKGAYPPGDNPAQPAAKSSSQRSGKSASGSLSSSDRTFINKAAAGGLAEVEIGKLAQDKAESQQAKDLAAHLVQDHTKANDQLKQIAEAKGIKVPDKLDKSSEREIDKLQKLSGAKFDHEFVSHEVSDHKKDIKDFDKEAKSTKDKDLKTFASKNVPTLEHHLKMAQSAESSTKTASRHQH